MGGAQRHICSNFQLLCVEEETFFVGIKNNKQRKPRAMADNESVKQPRGAMCSLVFPGENSDL